MLEICLRSAGLAALLCAVAAAAEVDSARAKAALAAAGVSAGFAVHLGSGDGRTTAGLAQAAPGLVVEGLSRDAAAVAVARARLHGAGVLGRANVQHHGEAVLPYAAWSVNLLVIEGDAPAAAEIARVLVPGGVAVAERGGKWDRVATASRPSTMDTWTHRRHGADRVPLSSDTLAGPPQVPQWIAGPVFQDTPLVATAELVIAIDSGQVLKRQTIYARDAFNGLLRWKRQLDFDFNRRVLPGNGWGGGDSPANRAMYAFCTDGRRFYAATTPRPVALDLADGGVKATYDVASPANAMAVADGTLVIACDQGLHAFATAGDAARWRADLVPLDLVLADGAAFALDVRTWPYDLVATDLASGRQRWRVSMRPWAGEVPAGRNPAAPVRLAFAKDGRLFLQARGAEPKVFALATRDGARIWEQAPVVRSPRGPAELRPIDLHSTVFANGLLWVSVGPNHKLGLDPATGETRAEGNAHDMNNNCQYSFATDRFVGFKGSYWMDVASGKKIDPYVTDLGHAGGCTSQGGLIANGLVYLGVKYCACNNSGDSLRAGFAVERETDPVLKALGQTPDPRKRVELPAAVVETGAGAPSAAPAGKDDWPMLGGGARRFNATAMAAPATLRQLWSVKSASQQPSEWTEDIANGDRITPPVIAAGKALIAEPDGATVLAVDAASGAPAWRFHAGGRIDGPPSLGGGLAVFGCRDGWLYALRLDDGRLAWRTRLAPSPRRLIDHGQPGSHWPVVGSPVLTADRAFVMSGYVQNYAGRLFAHGVDLRTGAVVWTDQRKRDNWSAQRRSLQALDGAGALYQVRDAQGSRTGFGVRQSVADGGPVKEGAGGFAIAHFPDRPLNRRYDGALKDPEVSAYDGTRVYQFTHQGDLVQAIDPATAAGGKGVKPVVQWTQKLPGNRLTAIIACGGTVIAGGAGDPARPEAGGFLVLLDPASGAKRGEVKLPAAPCYQGIAAAGGRLYVSLVDGALVCLGGS